MSTTLSCDERLRQELCKRHEANPYYLAALIREALLAKVWQTTGHRNWSEYCASLDTAHALSMQLKIELLTREVSVGAVADFFRCGIASVRAVAVRHNLCGPTSISARGFRVRRRDSSVQALPSAERTTSVRAISQRVENGLASLRGLSTGLRRAGGTPDFTPEQIQRWTESVTDSIASLHAFAAALKERTP